MTILEELTARNQRVTELEHTFQILTRQKAPAPEIERIRQELDKATRSRDWMESAFIRFAVRNA